MTPTLVTDRVILRAPRVADFDVFADIACSDRGRFLGGPMSREDAWADFAAMSGGWLLHGHGLWTIGAAQGVLGFVLLGLEPGDHEPELGFLLAESAEGHGYAFEAAEAARAHAYATFGWTTLVAAEMVAATKGLGYMVLSASQFLQTATVIMGIILIAGIAYLFDMLMRHLERRLVPWKGRG